MTCAPYDVGCTGTLTISGVSLNRLAWDIPNLTSLWYQHAVRGQSKTMTGLLGRRSFPVRVDEAVHDLYFVVNGDFDQAGAATADPLVGLQANLDYLWTNVLQPITSGDGTRPATLLMPSGATRSADVRTSPLVPVGEDVTDTRFAEFTLTVTIPGGRFT